MNYSRNTNRKIKPNWTRLGKKNFKRMGARDSSRAEQAAHGVNMSLRIDFSKKKSTLELRLKKKHERHKNKIRSHHCFHCKQDKAVSAFRSLGCTWCKQCELT